MWGRREPLPVDIIRRWGGCSMNFCHTAHMEKCLQKSLQLWLRCNCFFDLQTTHLISKHLYDNENVLNRVIKTSTTLRFFKGGEKSDYRINITSEEEVNVLVGILRVRCDELTFLLFRSWFHISKVFLTICTYRPDRDLVGAWLLSLSLFHRYLLKRLLCVKVRQ